MVGLMNTKFWLLAPPENQKRATLAEDTRLEQITCAADENHRRGGRRLGDVRATIDPSGIRDFTWTWQRDILASEHLLDVFLKHRVTGYEIRPTTISYSKRSTAKPPTLYELIIIGWGGMASNAAGLKVRDSCEACEYRDYTIATPSRLIDDASWDGSDLFIVWPLPRYPFASDRLVRHTADGKHNRGEAMSRPQRFPSNQETSRVLVYFTCGCQHRALAPWEVASGSIEC